MSTNVDIVIAGGGMVGVSLALQLDALLPSHVSILLVEGQSLQTNKRDQHRLLNL